MNILVTGAAGLYGVHLVDALVKKDFVNRVVGVDDFSRKYFQKDPFIKTAEFDRKFTLIRKKFYNITTNEFDDMEIDAIVHLAAFISIPESMEKEYAYFYNNEYGTFKLLQQLIKTKRWPLLIYASSPEVYGNPIYTPIDINHPMYPRSIYAVTKLAAEKHCLAMSEWYKYPVIVMRNFNTYGENQDIGANTGVISLFIINALKNRPLIVHNEGIQTRDFQYVKDAVNAYVLALERGRELNGRIYNIGSGRQTSIKELALKIRELIGSSSDIVFKPGRSADLMSLEADISLIKHDLGWEPRYTLEEGLKRTIEWYRKFIK